MYTRQCQNESMSRHWPDDRRRNSMAEPIRVLHVLGNTNLGGAESRIMDLYRHIDRSRVQFDFVVHAQEEGFFEKEIKELGGRVFRVPRFRMFNYFSYKRSWKRFFKAHHEFIFVQGHMTSTASIYLPLAKKAGIRTAAHARSAGVDKGIKGMLTRFLRRNLAKKADDLFTCSELAAISAYGEKAVRDGKTTFLPNAIDCSAFAFDQKMRDRIRESLSLQDAIVIGHVGRFHYAKNHEYLIRIFAALCEKTDRVQLILLGEGGLMDEARALCKELHVENNVHFLGNHQNIADYYQAMDFFLYPSRYEGMPGTIVEAQASGLPCLMSDTICREVIATDLVETMSIELPPEAWAERVYEHINISESDEKEDKNATMNVSAREEENMSEKGISARAGYAEKMAQAGFDVKEQAQRMMTFYETGRWQ